MGRRSGVVVTTAASWQAGSILISYCAEVAFPPWVCLGSRLGLRLPTAQRHTQRHRLTAKSERSVYVAVSASANGCLSLDVAM